jgi:hypothetical protein
MELVTDRTGLRFTFPIHILHIDGAGPERRCWEGVRRQDGDLITGAKRIREVEGGRMDINREGKKGVGVPTSEQGSHITDQSKSGQQAVFDWSIRQSPLSCSSCTVPSWQDENHLKNIRKLLLTREHL